MQLKETSKNVKLHCLKFYNMVARGIKYAAYSKELNKLGVVRNDYSIEIWNLSKAPFIERTIPGNYDDTVEVICWAGPRFFSVGLSGSGVKEWDLKKLTPLRSMLLTGEKGICMDYQKQTGMLAIGTEEGIMNIFSTDDNELQFCRLLDRQDHRIICCKFNNNGDKLASGSLDTVKIWNVQSGQVIHKMSTGRAESNQETIVWCVDFIDDNTVITGDSRGKVTFWDITLGAQIDYVHASNFDIMCLSISNDRKSFFCSGVEQILKKYTKVTVQRGGKDFDQWVRCAKRSKIHTHDILTMITLKNDLLVSGGVDGFLSFTTPDMKNFDRFGPFLQHPFVNISDENRLILLKYVNYLELWRLGSADEQTQEIANESQEKANLSIEENENETVTQSTTSKLYQLQEFPEKFLELRSKKDEMIICSSISNNGQWIAYSTLNSIRLFRFEILSNSKPKLQIVKSILPEFTACVKMLFTSNPCTLIIFKSNGTCSVFDLDLETFEHKETFDISEHHSDSIHHAAVSNCSRYLVMASLCNIITIWNLKKNIWTHSKTLPKCNSPVLSIKIRKNSPIAVISFSNNKILEYNIESHFIHFSAAIPENLTAIENPLSNVVVDPRRDDSIIFMKGNSINVLVKNESTNSKTAGKKAKVGEIDSNDFSVKTAKIFSTHLIHLDYIGEDELLALEVNPVSLTEFLPSPLRRKLFGKT
ncbi:CLUMA_CG015419, isoform A [Clunio marinus]|uniref:CLUMA_CG015419, isoform A n=1 Tax=Clunio marinus TaxID=568069 RepID=A0A1J1IR19_9DIPT|nr:CLUMA_CG015419, isoform A [Clunio marinus]